MQLNETVSHKLRSHERDPKKLIELQKKPLETRKPCVGPIRLKMWSSVFTFKNLPVFFRPALAYFFRALLGFCPTPCRFCIERGCSDVIVLCCIRFSTNKHSRKSPFSCPKLFIPLTEKSSLSPTSQRPLALLHPH